jgi:cobalt-zinc-cadmium efflux system protein
MTVIAGGGLLVNIAAASLLHAGIKHDLNMRGAWLHVMGDMLGSAAAITAGVLILAFGWSWADPICSILISIIIIVGAARLILDSVNVLLEGTPRHINIAAVENLILDTDGVAGVHDLHVWTIASGRDALSAHISHDRSVAHSELLARVRDRLHDSFGIDHLTIQMETLSQETEAVYVCETGTKCFEPARSRERSSVHAPR